MVDEKSEAVGFYLRPTGLVPRSRDQCTPDGPPAGQGYAGSLPLCGDGPFDFTAVEIIRRDGARAERRRMSLGDLWGRDAVAGELALADQLARLTEPRRRIAGLPMDRPLLMGVVNVTPDSFSDGGQFASTEAAIEHALRLEAEGAVILDIGGESTRPGSAGTPLEAELARVLPVIEGIARHSKVLVSIDTRKAEVMRQAIAAGAGMINDITALTHDPEALEVAATSGLPVVLMHALGDPRTMQDDPHYDDVATDVLDYLGARVAACEEAGIPRSRLVADPGIGFGKTFGHNLLLMSQLSLFHGLGCPVMLGASRKRFIGLLTNESAAGQRVNGSIGAALAGAAQGVQLIRVHDVKETKAALDVFMAAIRGDTDDGRPAQ
jgi:dihydropteroate synthase